MSDLTRLAYLATTRTGQHPRLHELVELALIERTPGHPEKVSHWRLRPQRMHEADPEHLRRTGFLDRPQIEHDVVAVDATLGTAAPASPHALAADLQHRLFGAIVLSLDPGHDVPFLSAYLERHGALPGWLRSIDITAAAAGALQGLLHGWYGAALHLGRPIGAPHVDASVLEVLPWDPYQLARGLGISHVISDASDAPARARLAVQVWDLLSAPPPRAEQPASEPTAAPAGPAQAQPTPGEPPYADDRLVAPRSRRPDETAVMDLSELDVR